MKKSAIMMIDISLKDQIETLFFCADIFEYPTKEACHAFYRTITPKFSCKFAPQDEIEAEYIRIFTINSVALKCVPYASWWLDSKMSGVSLAKINQFYTHCGYEFDLKKMKKPADHISFMIRFIAILAEEKKEVELKEFIGFLSWFEKFVNSLKDATDIEMFSLAGELSLNIINSLKEEI